MRSIKEKKKHGSNCSVSPIHFALLGRKRKYIKSKTTAKLEEKRTSIAAVRDILRMFDTFPNPLLSPCRLPLTRSVIVCKNKLLSWTDTFEKIKEHITLRIVNRGKGNGYHRLVWLKTKQNWIKKLQYWNVHGTVYMKQKERQHLLLV